MPTVIRISEQYQHFVEDVKESFWGDLYGRARQLVQQAIKQESMRMREVYLNCERYERSENRRDHRNGFYYREFQTRFGCLRLKIARSRNRSFLPAVIGLFQRRAVDVALLVREAFLRGLSTRQVGRVISCLELGPLSAQTVSRLSRHLDAMVQAFHQQKLNDEWAYLFLDGVSLRVRRPAGRKRVQMLVAYGVRRNGSRQLLAFAQPGRKPGGLGRAARRSLSPRSGRRKPSAHRHRRLPRPGPCHRNGLPACAASALLGAQDAQSL